MNGVKSEKHGISPSDIEKKSLTSERFKTLFNFERIKGSKIICNRLDKYNKKKTLQKRKKYSKI